ncbi:acyl dehydratase [Peribacillus frigoritolerans]|uniref:MaoC/PaaZ C-terminal domain-containing protein n=1 Tax=Peribacillus frigoritolerans TaxID=450367 RepID=UPI00209D7AA4|nr:MaoC/PaaZ C-terminal domain-containing protein [Peribacillus frigoritolerans]MCP1490044.1 acyl dehydratase [Peribacillus frigoritolerans]
MTTLTELHIGDSLHSIKLAPVTRLDLIKYAGASGDFNPIHTIDEEAKNAGLPGIIAHGMWTMGNLAKLFSNLYEIGFIEEYKIRFKGMVFLNDVITLQADLKEKNGNRYFFSVAATNQSGKEAISGEVIFKTY